MLMMSEEKLRQIFFSSTKEKIILKIVLCFDTTRVEFFFVTSDFFQYFLSLFFKREFREKCYSISKMLIPEKRKLTFTQPVWIVKMCFDISSLVLRLFLSRYVKLEMFFMSESCFTTRHESLGLTNR